MRSILQLIQQGEPVAPNVANRGLQQLDQNFNQLLQWFEAARIGSTVFAREVTVDATVIPGTPVYLDTATGSFKAARAQFTTDPNGLLYQAESAQTWGVVYFKHNATLADILLFGYAPLDISQVTETPITAGLYYMSGQIAGRLTRQRPPVSVPVLRSDGAGNVLVMASFMDLLDSHRHHRFVLVCRPCGTHIPPEFGDRHEIVDPDASLAGWLPADHESFEGHAPADAKFGYNLAAQPSLANAWPPIPLTHAYAEWDRGLDAAQGYHGIPLGPDGLLVLDRYGLWWMSDCYGDVPWPADWDTTVSQESQPQGSECPRSIFMDMVLWFTKLNVATGSSVVTSLMTRDDRILLRCVGTQLAANRGDLEIALDLSLGVEDTNEAGYQVLKTMTPAGMLLRGPVTEGLYTTSPNVTLTSDVKRRLVADDENSPWLYQGTVRVNVSTQATVELYPQLVRLEGATEEHYPVLYLGLPENRVAKFIARFDVPADAAEGASVRYRARIIGRQAGTLPELTLAYRIVNQPPDGLTTPVTVSPSYTTLNMDTGATLTEADQCVEATSEPIEVSPGDVVEIKVERDVDDYTGELGVLRQVLVLQL
jgi:hypothetical protein